MIIPRYVLGGNGFTPPSDKLNIAAIGVGGQGAWDLEMLESENIVSLCDVDWKHAAETSVAFKNQTECKQFLFVG
jgi:tRNA A37 threonylcarbamoyladenosine dehydratase